MNDKAPSLDGDKSIDPKVLRDWERVQARRSEINSREGGDTRRRAILERAGLRPRAS